MTNTTLELLTNQELISIYHTHIFNAKGKMNWRRANSNSILKRYIGEIPFNSTIHNTQFLGDDVSIQERVLYVLSNLTERIKCIVCGGGITNPVCSKVELRHTCSASCSTKNAHNNGLIITKESAIKSVINWKIAIENKPACEIDEWTKSRQKTIISLYGKDAYIDISHKVRATKLERYGDANYNNRFLAKVTCNERYGTDEYLKSDHYKATLLDRYGSTTNTNHAKAVLTKAHRYKNNEIYNRACATKLERYGDAHYNNIDQAIITKQERYSDKNYNNQNKFISTCMSRYGVKHPMHNIDILKSNISSKFSMKYYTFKCGKVIELMGYEPVVVGILESSGYDYERISGGSVPIIDYFYNKSRKYFPDLYIKDTNTIIEVKSNFTLMLSREMDMNHRKWDKCVSLGYNFQLWVVQDDQLSAHVYDWNHTMRTELIDTYNFTLMTVT